MDGGDGDKTQETWETKVDMIRGQTVPLKTILKVWCCKVSVIVIPALFLS